MDLSQHKSAYYKLSLNVIITIA